MGFGSNPMPGGGGKLRKFTTRTQHYFNSPLVINAMDKATRLAMMKSAARIRMIARRSMRYITATDTQVQQVASGKRKRVTKVKHSLPGQPPKAIRPHPWIRKGLDFAYDFATKTAVIGPVQFPPGRRAVTPRKLELGGMMERRKNPRRTLRKVGGAGEIRFSTSRPSGTRYGSTKYNGVYWVGYTKLRTASQAAKANRINALLYGPLYEGGKMLLPRPYMKPALLAEVPFMARRLSNSLWAHSVH